MKPVIIGVGNVLLQDEGVGVHIVNRLKKHQPPLPYDFIDGGTGGVSLLDIMRPYKKVVIIDAVKSNKTPGSVVRIEKPVTSNQKPDFSLHQASIPLLLELVTFLRLNIHIAFIGVVPYLIDYGSNLSPYIKERFGSILEQVVGILMEGTG